MAPKLTPKVILEGTRLTQKTDIAFALNENPRVVGPRKYRYHSPIISAEWCGFTNEPWGRGLINFDEHEVPMAMETYGAWARIFELQRYYSWMVDRFHLSTAVYQELHRGRRFDFGWLEERLLPLNFRLVLCIRRAETFPAARTQRLVVSGNPSQYDDLNHFIAEQELFRAKRKGSRLISMELDVSNLNSVEAADKIADWLEATGGLHLD
ncbi:MAG: hypothetical protein HN348_07480 [Proteobacteria bacterium]|jgi:hypothetical protein|nr:hypothetical protein [Pseudomonadota bacterium]